jgi:hypothetical protein
VAQTAEVCHVGEQIKDGVVGGVSSAASIQLKQRFNRSKGKGSGARSQAGFFYVQTLSSDSLALDGLEKLTSAFTVQKTFYQYEQTFCLQRLSPQDRHPPYD